MDEERPKGTANSGDVHHLRLYHDGCCVGWGDQPAEYWSLTNAHRRPETKLPRPPLRISNAQEMHRASGAARPTSGGGGWHGSHDIGNNRALSCQIKTPYPRFMAPPPTPEGMRVAEAMFMAAAPVLIASVGERSWNAMAQGRGYGRRPITTLAPVHFRRLAPS